MSDDLKQNVAPPSADPKQPKEQQKEDPQQQAAPEGDHQDGAAEPDRGTRESARRVTAAASNPGSIAAKRRQRAESRQNLNVGTSSSRFDQVRVRGDMAGRDIYHISTSVREVDDTYEIGRDIRMSNSVTYVKPPNFDALVSLCERRAIVVIRVARGQGKFATALRLADEVCSGALHGLSPKKTLDEVDPASIQENAHYLLTGLTQEQAKATLTRHSLARMSTHLSEKNAGLVIAIGAEIRLGHDLNAEFSTELTDIPACHEVFRAHLEHHAGTETADRLLASPEVVGLRDTELAEDAGPRAAADLARLLAEVQLSGREHAETVASVRESLAAHKKRAFDDWFAHLDGLAKHSFVIALATLNGLPYEMITYAGRTLENRLTKPAHGNVQNLSRDQIQPFRTSLTARLKEFDAKLVSDNAEPPADVVMFNDPDRPRDVLLHVWREYGEAHEGVVNWLFDLGGHKVDEVRVRAGVTAGLLASVAYEFVLHSVIERWANHENEHCREAAAIAVDAVNSIPAFKERVHTLVREWCEKGTPRQVATGIRVYGGSVGLDHPGELFASLDEHAGSTHAVVLDAVFESLAELAEAGVVGVSDRALMTTRNWATSRNRDLRITGNLAFLLMSADLLWPAGATRDGDDVRWPLLLRVADNSAEWRAIISQMWTAALFDADTADAALAVLDRWAGSAERNEKTRTVFVRLMHDAATNIRVTARLRQAVDGWADRNNSAYAPQTAAALAAFFPSPQRERTSR
jgi:hypothetical protein